VARVFLFPFLLPFYCATTITAPTTIQSQRSFNFVTHVVALDGFRKVASCHGGVAGVFRVVRAEGAPEARGREEKRDSERLRMRRWSIQHTQHTHALVQEGQEHNQGVLIKGLKKERSTHSAEQEHLCVL